MNNNHTKKPIKLESLDNIQIEGKLQELNLEEVSFIQGGLSIEGEPFSISQEKGRIICTRFFPPIGDFPIFKECTTYLPVIL